MCSKENLIEIRCPVCRALILKMSDDSLGLVRKICSDSKCRTESIFLISSGKVRLVNPRLPRNKSIFDPLPEDIKKAIIDSLSK